MDRWVVDALADWPVRIQHRSGHLWVLNSAGWRDFLADRGTLEDVEADDLPYLYRSAGLDRAAVGLGALTGTSSTRRDTGLLRRAPGRGR